MRVGFDRPLAQQGVDLLTISKLLGHADTRITSRHYAHLRDKTLAAAVMKLPSLNAQSAIARSGVFDKGTSFGIVRRLEYVSIFAYEWIFAALFNLING